VNVGNDCCCWNLESDSVKVKVKVKKRKAVCATSTAPLRKLTCHMESHSVTYHSAEVTFPPLPQPIKAGTRFSDPRGMQG